MRQIAILFISWFMVAGCGSRVSDSGSGTYSALADNEARIQACRTDLLRGRNLADAHYQLGQIFQGSNSDNLLAVWHYQQFIATCDGADPRLPEVRILLEHAEKKYYQQLQEHFDKAIDSDLALKVKLLQENNQHMKQWISRLDRENFALREMLLAQRQASSPKTPPAPAFQPAVPPQAAAAPRPPASPAVKMVKPSLTHQVVAGETLSKIAEIYYASSDPAKIRLLLEANPSLKNPKQLRVGSVITIPME